MTIRPLQRVRIKPEHANRVGIDLHGYAISGTVLIVTGMIDAVVIVALGLDPAHARHPIAADWLEPVEQRNIDAESAL